MRITVVFKSRQCFDALHLWIKISALSRNSLIFVSYVPRFTLFRRTWELWIRANASKQRKNTAPWRKAETQRLPISNHADVCAKPYHCATWHCRRTAGCSFRCGRAGHPRPLSTGVVDRRWHQQTWSTAKGAVKVGMTKSGDTTFAHI